MIRDHSKLLLTYDGNPGRMKYPPKDFRPQLYNLKNDPHETENLAASNPKLVNQLAKRINRWYPVKDRKTITEWSDKPVVTLTAD